MTLAPITRRLRAVPVLICALAVPAAAQPEAVIVPGQFALAEAPGSVFWAASPFESRRQLLIDRRHLKGRAGHEILELALRRNTGSNKTLTGGRLWIEVRISNTRSNVSEPSPVFAQNRGPDDRVVLSRYVTFPATPASPKRPAPWLAPHAVALKFARRFTYLGGTLVIETTTRLLQPTKQGKPSPPWWTADGRVAAPVGRVEHFGASCVDKMPGQPASAEPASLALGASALFQLFGPARSGVALFTLGGRRLDIDLSGVGAPGCKLHTNWWLLQPTALTPIPRGRHTLALMYLPLPPTPSLAGASLISQWIVLDPGVNRLGLTTSNGVKATIGRPTDDGIAWIESAHASAAVGRILFGRAPVLRLTFAKP